MRTIITSDVHLGSPHSQCDRFMRFVKGLPEDAELVLNGDTLHTHIPKGYPPHHLEALNLLREESKRRTIIWIRGNHDEQYVMPDPGLIRFQDSHHIGKQLYIAHGFEFDNVMPYNKVFILLFRAFHHLRILLGAESIHVAMYAKRFPFLYQILLRYVSMNAIEYAKENHYDAVVCGHTHYKQDFVQEGVRYINTGAWTEKEVFCLVVDGPKMELQAIAV